MYENNKMFIPENSRFTIFWETWEYFHVFRGAGNSVNLGMLLFAILFFI